MLLMFRSALSKVGPRKNYRADKSRNSDRTSSSSFPKTYLSRTSYHKLAFLVMFVQYICASSQIFRVSSVAEMFSRPAKNPDTNNLTKR